MQFILQLSCNHLHTCSNFQVKHLSICTADTHDFSFILYLQVCGYQQAVLTTGMVQCDGCLGNTSYPSVFLLKIHNYRTLPVPKHVRVVYSQQKLGFWHPRVWTVACFCCVLYFLLSQMTGCNYLWFSSHCVLHFVTGLNERDIYKITGMLN